MNISFQTLSKGIPDHEHEAESNDNSQDDCVTPLAEVDLVHEIVYQRKLVGQIIELSLNSLE